MSGYLMDTSVFVAAEQGRPLGAPPDGEVRVSVATLAELGVGLRRSPSDLDRAQRQRTLDRARGFIPLVFDEPVAERFADIVAAAGDAGRRAGVVDAIIAATGLTHDLTVWTHDDDFDVLAELAPGLRVHRG